MDDWEFLESCFARDRARSQEIHDLKSLHQAEVEDLVLKIDAFHLQTTSAKAYHDETQTQLEALKSENEKLQATNADLTERSSLVSKRLESLECCYQVSCEVLKLQSEEVKQKRRDLEAVRTSLEQLKTLYDAKMATRQRSLVTIGTEPECLSLTVRDESQGLHAPCETKFEDLHHPYEDLTSASEQETFRMAVTTILPKEARGSWSSLSDIADERFEGVDVSTDFSHICLNVGEEGDDDLESGLMFEMVD